MASGQGGASSGSSSSDALSLSRRSAVVARPVLIGAVVLVALRSARLALARGSALPSLLRAVALAAGSAIDALPAEARNALRAAIYLSLPMSALGAVSGLLYRAYGMLQSRVHHAIAKYCQVTMRFSNSDKHYDVVVDYIGTKCAVNTGNLTASTQPRQRPSFQEMLAMWLGGKAKTPTLYFQPDIQGFSEYFIWSDDEGKQHKIWLSKHVEKVQMKDSKNRPDPETLILSLWWTTDAKPLKDFLRAAMQAMLREEGESRVDIYVKHMWLAMWTKAVSKEKRDRDSIVLDENLADYVVEDIRNFFSKKTAAWYQNAGIPYRRGYLLYGPPGCGKTSFAQVLAGELNIDICLLNLSNQEMNDDDLSELLRAAPPRSMMLLEDVDAIFVERTAGKEKQGRGGGISFSGLLNALDGAAAQEGCIIMLTTNHKDRLDEALIRPGRCDVHVHVTKASKDQALRMFYRFFAKEVRIKSVEGPDITTTAPHGFTTGEAVMYKCAGGDSLIHHDATTLTVQDKAIFYVRVVGGKGARSEQRSIQLYRTQQEAMEGGTLGRFLGSGGAHGKLHTLPEAANRFSSRIPEKQVSMATLQGYLMKQRLSGEQHVKAMRDRNELPAHFAGLDPNSEEFKFLANQEVECFASEAAVMNVHELLDVKPEAEVSKLDVYDHFRRVGLHRFAPLFEHFGVRSTSDITKDLVSRMEAWHPDLKVPGRQKDRLVALLGGESSLDEGYALADLSILRDRFISTFRDCALNLAEPSTSSSSSPAPAPATTAAGAAAPAASATAPSGSGSGGAAAKAPPRLTLLRQSSNVTEPRQLSLMELAHKFQETLEDNGKTDISMWQLHAHFERFRGDPAQACQQASRLRHRGRDRTQEELKANWMTTFAFLRRLGLEKYAYDVEDQNFHFWCDWKHLGKDDLKNKFSMSEPDAVFCHAVLTGDTQRFDLLRKYSLPDFRDLVTMFAARFPEAADADARTFALNLTDELGWTEFSCLQVEKYLENSAGPSEALQGLTAGLPPLATAQAARVRPEAPPPPEEPKDWVCTWLKAGELPQHGETFLQQALKTREDVLGAGLDHKALEAMGVKKLGERCRILRMIVDEEKKPPEQVEAECKEVEAEAKECKTQNGPDMASASSSRGEKKDQGKEQGKENEKKQQKHRGRGEAKG
eukprot:TRINITY_DN11015_c0_g3_i1.p1 TRINITY_DN11015_c0_g3~~TRINITY_DN11015_c0_g3_i1.p1  ORF type:complete len:1162 (-),score=288.27 TRINITY_DN11015_c0_g3_i1:82-3567(-)